MHLRFVSAARRTLAVSSARSHALDRSGWSGERCEDRTVVTFEPPLGASARQLLFVSGPFNPRAAAARQVTVDLKSVLPASARLARRSGSEVDEGVRLRVMSKHCCWLAFNMLKANQIHV